MTRAKKAASGPVDVAVYDYGVGNIHSLRKALVRAGAEVTVTTEPADLADATIVALPGVGAFGHVMERVEGAREVLRARHDEGRPILGICIGMQVLYEGSGEASGVPGLGVLSGRVERLAPGPKVPHMGWNTLAVAPPPGRSDEKTVQTKHPLRHAMGKAGYVYYVHSYAAPVTSQTIATTTYGERFAAAVRDGNTIGLQFHPEKSSDAGGRILEAAVRTLAASWEARG